MIRVILVTPHVLSQVGHGGIHRTFQIAHDIQTLVGAENLQIVTFPLRSFLEFRLDSIENKLLRIRRRFKAIIGNPVKLFSFGPYFPNIYWEPQFLAGYEKLIRQVDTPAICILEHTGFSDLIAINARFDIPTICCPQNLESWDMLASPWKTFTRWDQYSRSIDWANEIQVLAKCQERLLISKIEVGMINGLGVNSRYYPYLPVGDIRMGLDQIRRQRCRTLPEKGLFLVIGSANHRPSGAGFRWLLDQVERFGLPAGVRLVFAGMGTDALPLSRATLSGIEFRGFLPQAELDSLLIKAQGVLIPQWWGFGALTRLVELVYAGIPIVVSDYPFLATDMPLQIKSVGDDWNVWVNMMEKIMLDAQTNVVSEEEYMTWERHQLPTLSKAISDLSSL